MPAQAPQGGGILQVHPTRRCNLSCRHCYSSSSPDEHATLEPGRLSQLIEDGARLGFDTVSLSGGEPLLYEGLAEVLQTAARAGCSVNLVSNGILVNSARYASHAGAFSVVALSLDGLAERHDTIRGRSDSFVQVQRAARLLHSAGQAFGIIHTLTSESLDEVEALAQLASDWGASLLQLHPFEAAGRGAHAMQMTALDEHERLIAYLLVAALARRHPALRLQLDLVHRDVARRAPAALQATRDAAAPRELVVDEDGVVVPLSYGLDRRWTVVDIGRRRLREAWPDFLGERWPVLRQRVRSAALAVARGRFGEVAPWHATLRRFAAMGLDLPVATAYRPAS